MEEAAGGGGNAMGRRGELLLGLLWTVSVARLQQMMSAVGMSGMSGMIKSGAMVAGMMLGCPPLGCPAPSSPHSPASNMPIRFIVVGVPQILQPARGSRSP